jgi:2-polyprenyl-3-methyl-5-hydroxy-6-metoxy-1,4-benzoquinol methylase
MDTKRSLKKLLKLSCPVCKSKRTEEYWAMPGYRLAHCLVCDTTWDPVPPEAPLLQYDKSYFINENPKGGYTNYFEGMRINRRTFSDRLKKIEKKLGKKGKLLDVGCALGDCLLEAKKLGWKDAEGIEVSHYAFGFAKERGLKVKEGILNGNSYKANSFDAVTYQDVIEHIPDPVNELKKIFKILRRGGIIFLVTPDIGGIWSKLLGPLWYHYKPHEHLVYFSEKSIRSALQEAGFKNIETRKTYHVLSLEYILNRLRYYFPSLFELILKVITKTPFKNIPFKSYTGELEAWGVKPK